MVGTGSYDVLGHTPIPGSKFKTIGSFVLNSLYFILLPNDYPHAPFLTRELAA
jgi:hypothetical protein